MKKPLPDETVDITLSRLKRTHLIFLYIFSSAYSRKCIIELQAFIATEKQYVYYALLQFEYIKTEDCIHMSQKCPHAIRERYLALVLAENWTAPASQPNKVWCEKKKEKRLKLQQNIKPEVSWIQSMNP